MTVWHDRTQQFKDSESKPRFWSFNDSYRLLLRGCSLYFRTNYKSIYHCRTLHHTVLFQTEQIKRLKHWQPTSGRKGSYPIKGLDRSIDLQEFKAPSISRHSAHEGGKVVSRTHRPPLAPPPETSLVLISVKGYVDPGSIVRPKELSQ